MWLVWLEGWVLLLVRYGVSFLSKAKPDWSQIILRGAGWIGNFCWSLNLWNWIHISVSPNFPEMSLEPIGSPATNLSIRKQKVTTVFTESSPFCVVVSKGGFLILPWEETRLSYWCHTENHDMLYDFWVLFAWSHVENKFSPFTHLWRGLA